MAAYQPKTEHPQPDSNSDRGEHQSPGLYKRQRLPDTSKGNAVFEQTLRFRLAAILDDYNKPDTNDNDSVGDEGSSKELYLTREAISPDLLPPPPPETSPFPIPAELRLKIYSYLLGTSPYHRSLSITYGSKSSTKKLERLPLTQPRLYYPNNILLFPSFIISEFLHHICSIETFTISLLELTDGSIQRGSYISPGSTPFRHDSIHHCFLPSPTPLADPLDIFSPYLKTLTLHIGVQSGWSSAQNVESWIQHTLLPTAATEFPSLQNLHVEFQVLPYQTRVREIRNTAEGDEETYVDFDLAYSAGHANFDPVELDRELAIDVFGKFEAAFPILIKSLAFAQFQVGTKELDDGEYEAVQGVHGYLDEDEEDWKMMVEWSIVKRKTESGEIALREETRERNKEREAAWFEIAKACPVCRYYGR